MVINDEIKVCVRCSRGTEEEAVILAGRERQRNHVRNVVKGFHGGESPQAGVLRTRRQKKGRGGEGRGGKNEEEQS